MRIISNVQKSHVNFIEFFHDYYRLDKKRTRGRIELGIMCHCFARHSDSGDSKLEMRYF